MKKVAATAENFMVVLVLEEYKVMGWDGYERSKLCWAVPKQVEAAGSHQRRFD
jgi:hypothetical protein